MDNSEIVEDIEMGIIAPSPLLSRSQTRERNNEEPSSDIESTGNTTPSPLLPSSQTRDWDTEEPSWSKPLYDALKRNDWDAMKEILDREPKAINGPVGRYPDTPLVIAVYDERDMRIIENLINMTSPPEKLVCSLEETINRHSWSAIYWAVLRRNYSAAKLLISKYPPMLISSCEWEDNRTPIQTALHYRETQMACYMLKLAFNHLQPEDLQKFEQTFELDLVLAIERRNYDYAYNLIQLFPKLALDYSPWRILIEECTDFHCQSRFNRFHSLIYSWVDALPLLTLESITHEWEKAHHVDLGESTISSQVVDYQLSGANNEIQKQPRKILKMFAKQCKLIWYSIGRLFLRIHLIWNIRRVKSLHLRTRQLVRSLCAGINQLDEENCSNVVHRAFISAVHNGMSDIIEEILPEFPDVILQTDEDGNNAFQFAIKHRDGKLFHALHKRNMYHRNLLFSEDAKGNNILHLVGKRAQRYQLDTGSREVLQLQREFQWYKEMEKLLPRYLRFKKNSDIKVPLQIFDEEHI